MLTSRLLVPMIALAACLLIVAIAITTGEMPLRNASLPAIKLPGMPTLGLPDLGGLSGSPAFASGIAIGWLLRWLYTLPWGAVPRAIVSWLLSWRSSAALAVLAIACTAVLLLF